MSTEMKDVFPIVYETENRPASTIAVVRIFGRIKSGSTFEEWFYPNGRSHSDWSYSETAGDMICSRFEGSADFLNGWTSSDWSFLQEDGTWRNWRTYLDPETGKMNDFSPATSAMEPYPPFCVTKVCFFSRYDFILLVHVTDKADKIRMNGYCGEYQHGNIMLPHIYRRFTDCEFIPAREWLSSEYFIKNAESRNVILHVEPFDAMVPCKRKNTLAARLIAYKFTHKERK